MDRIAVISAKSHYHIRWSRGERLDWEYFNTPEEAEANAKQLVGRGETYTVEEFDESRVQGGPKTGLAS